MCSHSNRTMAFVAEWVVRLDADPKAWDQHMYNVLGRSGFDHKKTHESNDRLFYGWNGQLVIGILPIASFCSGHTFHVQHLPEVSAFSCFTYVLFRVVIVLEELKQSYAVHACQRIPELWMPTVIIAVRFSLTDLFTFIIWNIGWLCFQTPDDRG